MLNERISTGRVASVTLRSMLLVAGVVLGAGGAGAFAAQAPETAASENPRSDPNNKWGFFEQYCEKCHNSTDWAGGVAYDTMSQDSIPDDAKVLEEAVRKLRGRLMPPPGKPQPDQQTIDGMVSWLETHLDEAGAAHPIRATWCCIV